MDKYIVNCEVAGKTEQSAHLDNKNTAVDLAQSIRASVKKRKENLEKIEFNGVVDPENGGKLYFGQLNRRED